MNARLHPAGSVAAGLILLACLLTGCESTPAAPVEAAAPQCVPIAAIQSIARQQHVQLARVEPVAPFLAALNNLPPKTDLRADTILVMKLGQVARLIFATNGCARSMAQIPWDTFLRLAGEGA